MGSSNLALGDAWYGSGPRTGTVVGSHVVLKLLAVGARRGLPS
jgi:hypothetical protein